MLTVEEIKMFIDEDAASVKKHFARIGERYFDGDHDIKNCLIVIQDSIPAILDRCKS